MTGQVRLWSRAPYGLFAGARKPPTRVQPRAAVHELAATFVSCSAFDPARCLQLSAGVHRLPPTDAGRTRDARENERISMFVTPAYAQAGGDAASAFTSFIPLILIFAIMYFLLIRPQQKKVKEHQKMVEALRRGDQVVTQGGVKAKVTKVIDDAELEVEIAEGVRVRVIRNTIVQVLSKTEPANS
jgi:preprotein translocase subunit YajC